MAKSIKGSAIFGEDGTYIFTPYAEGQPENVSWLPLATVTNGKLDCSKKKVRMVLTMERTDLSVVHTTFLKAFAQLSKAFVDKRVNRMYKAAATARPCDIAQKNSTRKKKASTAIELESTENDEEV